MIPLCLSRRNFIIYSGITSAFAMYDLTINSSFAIARADENYYKQNFKRFMDSFEKTSISALEYLRKEYDQSKAEAVCKNARNKFSQRVLKLPYIGGDNNPGTEWIILSGLWVSFLEAMKEAGFSLKKTARMMYDIYVEDLKKIPVEKMEKRGRFYLSDNYIKILKKWTIDSKKSNGWKADFIQGDGKTFDYGINYIFCPSWEYFKSVNAENIAPYFCLLDFPEHKLMGTGLKRTKTLANGDKICDFRFKKGRYVTQDWSTEVSSILK